MKNIITKLSKEANVAESIVEEMFSEIGRNLLKEGCEESDPRYIQYMVRRAKKRLKIQESKTYVKFKDFFKEK